MRPTVLLSGLRADSHTWGLAFLQLWLEERGFRVRNLGACVAPAELAAACAADTPVLVVLTTVNGHGLIEAEEAMEALRASGVRTPVVIGGKLTISPATRIEARTHLLSLGFSGVFIGHGALDEFDAFLVCQGLLRAPAGSGDRPGRGHS
jgi:methylaspartate mutase sigma subunit